MNMKEKENEKTAHWLDGKWLHDLYTTIEGGDCYTKQAIADKMGVELAQVVYALRQVRAHSRKPKKAALWGPVGWTYQPHTTGVNSGLPYVIEWKDAPALAGESITAGAITALNWTETSLKNLMAASDYVPEGYEVGLNDAIKALLTQVSLTKRAFFPATA